MKVGEQSGFTLIEAVIALVVFVIALVAISDLFLTDIHVLTLAKSRAMGLSLANQQMEYIRDLPYDSVATQHGAIYPAGTIADDQTQTVGSYSFRVHTSIEYVDDPYDGNETGTIAGKPTDLYPYDYKKAEVMVYTSSGNTKVADLTTNVAAKAAETASNTGILSIKVQNASGQAVPNATVTITNSAQSPAVNITTTADNNGFVDIPKLPQDTGHNYHITATLAGYSTDQTGPGSGGSNPDANVLVQQITPVTLTIDLLGSINATVTDTSGNPVGSLAVKVTGAKTTASGAPKYSSTQTTSVQGTFAIANAEWDSYSFSVPVGYQIVSTSPYQPAALNPGANLNVAIVVTTTGSYPTVSSVNPTSNATNDTTVPMTITGTNLNGATLRLKLAGQSDIVATGVSSSSTSVQGNFDLTGAAVGAWDLVVTTAAGTVTETGGLNVTAN